MPAALTDYIVGRQEYDYADHGRTGNVHTEFVPDEIVERVDQFAIYPHVRSGDRDSERVWHDGFRRCAAAVESSGARYWFSWTSQFTNHGEEDPGTRLVASARPESVQHTLQQRENRMALCEDVPGLGRTRLDRTGIGVRGRTGA